MLKNKILKSEIVPLEKLNTFQPEDFKKCTKDQLGKLKKSLIKNGFTSPFFVWQHNQKIKIIDGHHRLKAILELKKEGCKIPDEYPVIFLDIKNIKEAKKAVLLFNSHYAKVNQDSLADFIVDLNIEDLIDEIEIPEINLDFSITDNEKEIDENIETTNECPKCNYVW